MKKLFSIYSLFLFTLLETLFLIFPSSLEARCGYYAGYGYRCFGDKGGTGGKVFKEMDENTKKCGYWDPGCTKSSSTTGSSTTSSGTYTPPQSDGGYQSPTVGPGYQRPGSR